MPNLLQRVETVNKVFDSVFVLVHTQLSLGRSWTIVLGGGNRVCWTSFRVWPILHFPVFLSTDFDCLAHFFYSANFFMLNSHLLSR